MDADFIDKIFKIKDRKTFREIALKVFLYQAQQVETYGAYLDLLGIHPLRVRALEEIPFLPAAFFKSRKIQVKGRKTELIFESSGTSGQTPAKHHVADAALYRKSFFEGFRRMYGDPEKLCILALLPAYLEREASSLVYMMDHLIAVSEHPDSGFYLDRLADLSRVLRARKTDGQPTLLLGVTFALLDLAEQFPQSLSDQLILMETGGMKGRRKEMVRKEVHQVLKASFGLKEIHSEYGMTELLSQAYSRGEGRFYCPPWMQVRLRDPNDPLSATRDGQNGGINVIDLANVYSCSFIATGDLGKSYADDSFEVLGRFDHSDVRGCNLMVV